MLGHIVRYSAVLVMIVCGSYANADNVIIPLRGHICLDLVSDLAETYPMQERETKSIKPFDAAFDYTDENRQLFLMRFNCYKNKLHRGYVGYRLTSKVDATGMFNFIEGSVNSLVGSPDAKKGDEFVWSYKNNKQIRKIEKGLMKEEEFFDFSAYDERWTVDQSRVKLSMSYRDNAWYISYSVGPWRVSSDSEKGKEK